MASGDCDPLEWPVGQCHLAREVTIFRNPYDHGMVKTRAEHSVRLVKISARKIGFAGSCARGQAVDLDGGACERACNRQTSGIRSLSQQRERCIATDAETRRELSSRSSNAEINQSRPRNHRESPDTCWNRENLPRLNFEFLISHPDIVAFRRHHHVRMNEAREACQ